MEAIPRVNLTFKVSRKEHELITPAKATPHEFKILSDIDDQQIVRVQFPVIQIYRRDASSEGKDPVETIRDAIRRALVFYYPFAGRVREQPGGKLVVECNDEGVVFIEADADVTLEEFGDALQPTIPCCEELLYDVPGSAGIVDAPLLLIQVTRLKCGGFIFGLRKNHTICDAEGIVLFMSAVGELARGAQAPSVPPVWERHLLCARDPPRVTCTHNEHREVEPRSPTLAPGSEFPMVDRSFFFGAAAFAALRGLLPPRLRGCSNFDLLTAAVWRCRTAAVAPDPAEEVPLLFAVNARRHFHPPLPAGYYGNVIATPVSVAVAGDLLGKPLDYAVELVREAKFSVTEEYMRSLADLTVVKNRPGLTTRGLFGISDLTRVPFGEVDFGWGKPAYGGPAYNIACFYLPYRNKKGEDGILLPIKFPADIMEAFEKELRSLLEAGARAQG